MSVYINNFLLALNNIITLEKLKTELANKYKVQDLKEVKIIISWQIIRDLAIKTLKAGQSVYIRDLLKEKNFTNCNTSTILIKVGSLIKINKLNNYEKANLKIYQQLISKLMYFAYKTKLDIAFTIERMNKHNTGPQKSHL